MRFFKAETFRQIEVGKTYEHTAKQRIFFRSNAKAFVYWKADRKAPEILAGYSDQPFEIDMKPGMFTVQCDGQVWVSSNYIDQQTFKTSEEVFTTLDRPSPLSPEMRAIAEMVRANQLERERYMMRLQDVERANAELRKQQLGGKDKLDVETPPAKAKTGDGKNTSGGKTPPETPAGEATGKQVEEPKPVQKPSERGTEKG